ncbi:MAG: prepilin-type N-terminal cleavage/methylation domain-containing protein [Motiliproteus sp.]
MKHRSEAGFTLVELLVAITLMALMLLLGYSGLRMGMHHWRSGQAFADNLMQERGLRQFLRQQLGQVISRDPQFRNGRALPQGNKVGARAAQLRQGHTDQFRGARGGLVFIAPLAAFSSEGGLHEIWIRLEGDPYAAQGRQLVMLYQPLDPDRQPFQLRDPRRVVLLEGLESMQLNYYGALAPSKLEQWRPLWRHQWQLPRLIRIRLNFTAKAGWPEFDLPLRLQPQPQRT